MSQPPRKAEAPSTGRRLYFGSVDPVPIEQLEQEQQRILREHKQWLSSKGYLKIVKQQEQRDRELKLERSSPAWIKQQEQWCPPPKPQLLPFIPPSEESRKQDEQKAKKVKALLKKQMESYGLGDPQNQWRKME